MWRTTSSCQVDTVFRWCLICIRERSMTINRKNIYHATKLTSETLCGRYWLNRKPFIPRCFNSQLTVRMYSRLQSNLQSSDVKRGRRIKSKSVLLIDESGTNLGIMDTKVAIQMAQAKGLELIQVSNDPNPVCKLISKKQLWEESKNQRERNKKDPRMIMKDVKLTTGISDHDLNTKMKTVRSLLERSHPVKIWVQKKKRYQSGDGRQQEELLRKVLDSIKEVAVSVDEKWSNKAVTCIVKAIQK